MMMEHNLAPCPFCGGKISLEAVCQTQEERRVHMQCGTCGMEFIHRQGFAYSTVGRLRTTVKVAIGRSFEEIWSGRADHDQT